MAENCNVGQAGYDKNHRLVQQTNNRNIMEKKEEVGKGCFELKSIGENQEFRVMTVTHWLSCWSS